MKFIYIFTNVSSFVCWCLVRSIFNGAHACGESMTDLNSRRIVLTYLKVSGRSSGSGVITCRSSTLTFHNLWNISSAANCVKVQIQHQYEFYILCNPSANVLFVCRFVSNADSCFWFVYLPSCILLTFSIGSGCTRIWMSNKCNTRVHLKAERNSVHTVQNYANKLSS